MLILLRKFLNLSHTRRGRAAESSLGGFGAKDQRGPAGINGLSRNPPRNTSGRENPARASLSSGPCLRKRRLGKRWGRNGRRVRLDVITLVDLVLLGKRAWDSAVT